MTITSSVWIIPKKLKIELPFIMRKNRLFRDGNILIPEKFLFAGENMIYILRDMLTLFEDEIKVKEIFAHIKCLEYDTEDVS